MKQIQSPSNWTLSIALAPIIVMVVIALIMKSVPTWAIVVSVISLVTYLALLAYFCIRQKCYGQLITNIVIIVLWIVVCLVQGGLK